MSKVTIDDFWPEFGKDVSLPQVTCDYTGSLAQRVLSYYNIPCSDSTGGSLPDIDIKQMDAMQVLKLSLLEESANSGEIYEPVMAADGSVEFKAVGNYSGNITDVYYSLQGSTFVDRCTGVMVSGKTPLAYRKPIVWEPIWKNSPQLIYDVGLMLNNECIRDGFNQWCTIVYNDPHLDSAYEDGIDNFYEISAENPYDTIVGYASYITWDKDEGLDKNVHISFNNNAKVLLSLDLGSEGLGTLQQRPPTPANVVDNLRCYENELEVMFGEGVQVPIPEELRYESVRQTSVDKFEGVEDVYIVGLKIAHLYGIPPTPADAVNKTPPKGSAKIVAVINETKDTLFKLNRGEHYEVAYEENTRNPAIVFVDNSLITDPIGLQPGGKATFFIDRDCAYSLDVKSGQRRDSEGGYILPVTSSTGILVKQILVSIGISSPSITVYHPQGWNNRARTIAESLEYLIAPLVVVNEKEPIGFNGRLIDRVSSLVDHDPTTAQDFEDSDYEKAIDEMSEGSGMVLSLSFLNAEQVEELSGALYNYLNSGEGIETTYVCGPDADPELGGTGEDGTSIVNAISYSYQDSNSYTISVQTGTKVLGDFAQVGTGGPSFKVMEEVTCKGTILQDAGNNVHFKVSIDGIGDRIAINMCPAVLRNGDKVMVAVHNNPVEV